MHETPAQGPLGYQAVSVRAVSSALSADFIGQHDIAGMARDGVG